MSVWFQVETADNDKVLGAGRFADPSDRSQWNDGTKVVRPDDSVGCDCEIPEDLFDENSNPNYRWNGTALEAL